MGHYSTAAPRFMRSVGTLVIMNTDDTVLETLPVISDYVEAMQREYTLTPKGTGLTITGSHVQIHLEGVDLRALERGRTPCNTALVYHSDCGISIGTYSEFFIQLGHPAYLYLDAGEWPSEKSLRFSIGKTQVIVGEASPLITFLTEPAFRDSDNFPEGFSELASVRLIGHNHIQARMDLSKALYYLNAHYLRPLGMFARLMKVRVEFEDPLGMLSGAKDFGSMFAKVPRSRLRKRADYTTIEPLILYNHAAQASNVEQFLSFYRVIEFFTNRSALASIEIMRGDRTVTANDILNFIVSRNEEAMLIQLVQNVLTAAQKKTLTSYAYRNRLVSDVSPKSFAKALYAFRNSAIHAKEPELAKTMLPDPFKESEGIAKWTYVARVIAERSIKTLNT